MGGPQSRSLKFPQRQQMFFIAAHDEIDFTRQRTFQNHFIVGIRRCARSALGRENQFSGFSQRRHPLDRFDSRIIQPQFFKSFMILGKRLALTTATHRPCAQAAKQSNGVPAKSWR